MVLAYSTGNWELSLTGGFVQKHLRIQPRIAYKINSETSVHGSLSISARKFMLGTGLSYTLSPASKLQMMFKAGFQKTDARYHWLAGMKFSLSYHGLNLSVPVMLGSQNATSNGYSLLFTLSAMAAATIGFYYYIFRDRKAKRYS